MWSIVAHTRVARIASYHHWYLQDPLAAYDNINDAVLPPTAGYANVGDRRLESVPAQLPSFAAQQQDSGFGMPFDAAYNLAPPTGGYQGMDTQGLQQDNSMPLAQQFLAQRASAPAYGRKPSSPFVEPEEAGGPGWLGPRASQGALNYGMCVLGVPWP